MSNYSHQNGTIQGDSSQDNATIEHSPSVYIITLQVVFSLFTFMGNLLIILVIQRLKNSKLRQTTKLSICYVSASHSLLSILLVGRLFKLPCPIFLLGSLISGYNILNGMAYLAYETFILMKKPCNNKGWVSMKICVIQIFVCNLVTLCLSVVGYIGMRTPDDPTLCYFTNGVFSPWFVLFVWCTLGAMIITCAVLQISTVQTMKKVYPAEAEVSVSYVNTMDPIVSIPVLNQSQFTGKSPLHRLAKILTISLACFVLCLSPIVICNIMFSIYAILDIENSVVMERKVVTSLSSLILVSGGLHTIVYFVMSSQIRDGVRGIFKCCLCK